MYVEEEDRIAGRASDIADWLVYVENLYADLISRPTETGSSSGFDPEPRVKPCEHRAEWRRGRLCLGCDNTNWRPLTPQEREENLGIDPYAAEVKRDVVIVESDSMRKARESARMDNVIAALERASQVRAGLEVQETVESRTFRLVSHKHHDLIKISDVIRQLRQDVPALLERISLDQLCWLVAKIMPGSLRPAPR